MRLALMVLACGLVVTPAAAASFDCAKAETAVEKAICADADLSAADEAMAAAFSAARKALSKPASGVVLDNQRRWIDFASRACTDDGEPLASGAYDEDGIACLTTLFTNRANALAAIGEKDGLALYSVDSFATAPDPDPESWSKIATSEISYVQIDDADAEAFNAFAGDIAAKSSEWISGEEPGTTDFGLTVAVELATPTRISLSISDYSYYHGAAHGNYTITYAHYLRDDGRALAVDDVFAEGDWPAALKPLIVQRLRDDAEKATGDANSIWDELDDLETIIADPARWDITEDGIAFQFQPYEVSAYAYGAPEALMTWDELAPWLTRGARALLTGA